ncbi:MAG: hypothetical protein ACXVEX_05065 [Actinomycetota bacterium]
MPPKPPSLPPRPQAPGRIENRPGEIAARSAGHAATAQAVELAEPGVAEMPVEVPDRRQIDKAAALQRIIRNIPRRVPNEQTEVIDPAAKHTALQEAARLAAQMEEQARLETEAEERIRQERLEEAMREAEERARQAAEERAQLEAEEKARLEALEQARLEAEQRAREAEERARKAEEAARLAEEQTRLAQEERARRAAEERARFEAEEQERLEAIERARHQAEEQARAEAEAAEERARRAAAERARLEAEEQARLEAAREAQRQAERQAEEAERLQREAEKEAERLQRESEKEAERLAREAAKSQKEGERDAKKAAAAAAKAARKTAKRRQAGDEQSKPVRRTRLDRRYDRQTGAFGLLDGETVTIMADGRSGFRRMTMFVTRYRVAIVSRRRRRPIVRWIPLEEGTTIETAWRGAPTLVVNAPIEVIPFKQRARSSIEQLFQLVQSEVREARSGGARRHSADLMQDWTDRTNELLDSSAGKLRLWIRRHPAFTLLWLASIVPVAYFITRSHF